MKREQNGRPVKKPKRSRRSSLIILSIVSVLMIGAVTGFIISAPYMRKPIIGLYGVDQATADTIRIIAIDKALNGGSEFTVRELDQEKTRKEQYSTRSGPDLIVGYNGKVFTDQAEALLEPDPKTARMIPTAIRNSTLHEERCYALPLQIDHFEVAYDRIRFSGREIQKPQTLNEIVGIAESFAEPGFWPLLCAGGNDEDLLLLITALTEAKGGIPALRHLTELLSAHDSFLQVLNEKLSSDLPAKKLTVKTILDELVQWRRSKLLHPEWYRMKDHDVISFMENRQTLFAFIRLSFHRSVPLRIIKDYIAMPFPSAHPGAGRALPTKVLIGAVPAGTLKQEEAANLLKKLISNPLQKELTRASGLAPVSATAEAQDKQASDVRLWAAASREMLPDIGRASRKTASQRAALAGQIRNYLEAEGVGF